MESPLGTLQSMTILCRPISLGFVKVFAQVENSGQLSPKEEILPLGKKCSHCGSLQAVCTFCSLCLYSRHSLPLECLLLQPHPSKPCWKSPFHDPPSQSPRGIGTFLDHQARHKPSLLERASEMYLASSGTHTPLLLPVSTATQQAASLCHSHHYP